MPIGGLPIAGAAAGLGPMAQNMMGGTPAAAPMGGGMAPPQGNPAFEQALAPIRQMGQIAQEAESTNPVLAPIMQQIRDLLKQAVIEIAQAQSAQGSPTPSGSAVPGGMSMP